MGTTPAEFIETAKRILTASVGESDCRAVISRAYYGALHEADGITPPEFAATLEERRSDSSHRAIIGGLQKWGNSITSGRLEARQLERVLKRMKGYRQKADYELHRDMNLDDAKDMLLLAESVQQHAHEVERKNAQSSSL